MFAHHQSRLETTIRVSLIVIILFNALVPTVAFAKSDTDSQQESSIETSSLDDKEVAESTPLLFTPPQIPYPDKTAPDPDQHPSPIPSKGEVEFTIVADPAIVPMNGLVRFNIYIRNNSEQELTGLAFTDHLEAGLEYSQDSASPVTYDMQKKEVLFSIDRLGIGEEQTFSYSATLTSAKRNTVRGKIWLHDAKLKTSDNLLDLRASAAIGVDVTSAGEQSEIAVLQTNGGWNDLGRLKIHMEKDTVGQNALVIASPTKLAGKGPELQFKLDVFQTSTLSSDAKGKLNEQTVDLKKQIKESFKHPAYLEINLDDYIDLDNIPAGQEAYVATYDETNKIWVKVPILEQNRDTNSVTVQAAHFSTWGAGLGSSLPQNGANVLLFDQPYTSLFTGAARYSLPIWTPPGRGGMQPDLSLSYSSSTVDGVLGDVQAPWVGVGWNMDGVEIVRKITTSDTGYGYENNFALTINGTLYDLTVNPNHPSQYYTIRSSFLYIERHNYALGNQENTRTHESPNLNDKNKPNLNPTGEWWEVVTTDGTRYRLGWNTDSQQLALMYGYSCTTGGTGCTTPDGAYASLGYAGLATDLVAMRWRVDKIEDTHKNYMSYAYEESHPASPLIPQFDRASFVSEIQYTGHINPNADPKYIVKFKYGKRTGDVPTQFNIWDNWDDQLLLDVKVCYESCGAEDKDYIRKYEFGYSVPNVPNTNGTLTLTDITTTSGDFSVDGVDGDAITSPTIKFTYENKPNRAVSGGTDAFTYPRLTKIENGYGGSLNYVYEHDGRGTNSWYNYHVKTVNVGTGTSTPLAAIHGYAYFTPIYTQANNLGELIGYTDVTETTYDFNGTTKLADTAHHFGTVGLDTGFELITEFKDPTGVVLRKSVSTYVTDNSKAPFTGWNYRYLAQIENFVRSNSTLIPTSKTHYVREADTGNLVIQEDYLGSILYRKHYYEYRPNFSSSVHILDKATRELLADASNNPISDTRYIYDRIIDYTVNNNAISTGDLTLVQKLSNVENPGILVTADTYFEYNDYGNVKRTCTFRDLRKINDIPDVDGNDDGKADYGLCTDIAYDSQTYTYPTTTTNPLGQSSTTSYIYQLGLPYKVKDINNWESTTKYDTLGRTLSVTPPGLSSPSVKYTYPPVSGGGVSSPFDIKMELWDEQANIYRPVWGIYDGMDRMLETQVWDADRAQLLITESQFNAQGSVSRQSLPYYANGSGGTHIQNASQFTETAYDALGRAIQVTSPGNIVSYTQYDGLTTTNIDPNGNKVARTADGLGRLKYIQEYNGSAVYATTSFSYDVADRIKTTTDAQNSISSFVYDGLGRKKTMIDPDMGQWQYEYDALGNLIEQTDARDTVIQFTYDDLNRLTSKDDITNSSHQVNLATYQYGNDHDETNLADNNTGFRIEMNDESSLDPTKWEYDNYGREITETRSIGGIQKISITTNDWMGRLLSVQYPAPDNELISYQYDALGRTKNFSNESTTFATIGYNTLSQIMNINLGNGVRVENDYDSITHRLDNRVAFKEDKTFLHFGYQYDPAGNITQLDDHVLDEVHTYQYDFLNRLTSAEAVNNTDFSYRQTFEYDKVGNILTRQDWEESDLIFKSDFEDTVTPFDWSSAVSDPNELWTIESNGFPPISGERSIVFDIKDNNALYVEDTTPGNTSSGDVGDETSYRGRFYFNPNSLTMVTGDILDLFSGYRGDGTQVLRIQLRKTAIGYQVLAGALNDSDNWNDLGWQTISNQWTAVEMSYVSLANAGSLSLWLNGVSTATVSSIDNDTNPINKVRLGGMGVEPGTRGQVLFDAFESHRSAYVGVLPQQVAYIGNFQPVGYRFPFSSGMSAESDAPFLQDQATDTPAPTETQLPTNTAIPERTLESTPDEYTKASLDMDGTDASQNFVDQTGKVWTAYGNAQVDTAQSVVGGSSGLFDGSGDYVASDVYPDFDFGTEDLTIDFWVKRNGNQPSSSGIISSAFTPSQLGWRIFFYSSTNKITFAIPNWSITSSIAIANNTWTHVAIVRSGDTVSMYFNGTQVASVSAAGYSFDTSSSGVVIGRFYTNYNGYYFNGWIDEVRLSKGIAKWNSNFNTPDPNHFAPTFTPTLTSVFTPTKTLTPTKTFTPTPTVPTATFTANPVQAIKWSFDETSGTTVNDSIPAGSNGTLIGGAQRVPGYGTYAIQFGTGQRIDFPRTTEMEPTNGFTLSAWVYPTEINQGKTYVILNKGGTAQDYRLYINTNKFLVFRVNDLSPNELVGPTLPLNQWTQVTAVYDRPAGMLKLYLFNVLVASRTVTGTISYNTAAGITISDSTNPYIGLIDEVELSSSAFSEPTMVARATAMPPTATITPTFANTPTETLTPSLTPSPTITPSPTLVTYTPTITLTPTVAPSPTGSPDPRWGTGHDGNLTVETGSTYNINTNHVEGRDCADAVAYNVTVLGSTTAKLDANSVSSCLGVGDEVLLINLQGTSFSTYNTGAFEFLRIASILDNDTENDTVVFTGSKVHWYGNSWRLDDNIGTGATQQRVMLMRVPNYNDLTVNGTLTANNWNGLKYGVVAYRVKGILSGASTGSINIANKGFSGGASVSSYQGASGTWYSVNGINGVGMGKVRTGEGEGGEDSWVGAEGGGGGYGTTGGNVNQTLGGLMYGTNTLEYVFLGSGGGSGVANDQDGSRGGKGGNGGGAILISAFKINFYGSMVANGENGGVGVNGGHNGGGGSGGSILIESDLASISSLSAVGGSGGGHGGIGRMAIYHKSTLPTITSANPSVNKFVIGSVATSTPVPTPVNLEQPIAWSTGNDGDLTITAGNTFNIHVSTQNTLRTCIDGGDGVSYSVISLNSSWAKISPTPADGCLHVGDEILLVNNRGTSSKYINVGTYEYLVVGAVSGDTVYFTTPKTKFYGENASDDSNIGTGGSQQKVMIARVPNYDTVTINANSTLTGAAWNGTRYGFIVFRANKIIGTGTISANALGYNGGASVSSYQGSSGTWYSVDGINGVGMGKVRTGEGEGGKDYGLNQRGAGAGYGTNGQSIDNSLGGNMYGSNTLEYVFLGSGGGSGVANDNEGSKGGKGGNGGGAILISALTMQDFTGSIVANGQNGGAGVSNGKNGGGGSGGSILIEGDQVSSSLISALGGSGGGYGGKGRIAVYYQTSFTGTADYIEKAGKPDSIFNADFETGDLLQWSGAVRDTDYDLSASDSADYWYNYGLSAFIDDNTDIYVHKSMPDSNEDLDTDPDPQTLYRARFYVNPNNTTMAAGDVLDLFDGYNNETIVFHVQMQKTTNSYQIRTGLLGDSGTWTDTSWYDISNTWNAVEIDYQALINDGKITLWLNNVQNQSIIYIDNDTRPVTEVHLGAQGVEVGTRGTLYFDDFESRRFSYIGTLPDPGVNDPQATNPKGWETTKFKYEGTAIAGTPYPQPHAVTKLVKPDPENPNNTPTELARYEYDKNGNMTCRVENGDTFKQAYNAENRISSITKVNGECDSVNVIESWTYTYDGDGVRVSTTYFEALNPIPKDFTAYYMGGSFEVTGSLNGATFTETGTKSYYAIAGMTIAVKDSSGVKYLLTDHLGSVVATIDSTGTLTSQQRYLPFGGARDIPSPFPSPTDFTYTGQRDLPGTGLLDYKARMFSPYINRFLQPDTVIPDLSNPQSWNRYSYVTNRPIVANDPTGHDPWWCDSKDHAQECQDNWISSRSSKVNARVYYLNAIGLGKRGTISPNSDPSDEQGYLIYRMGLIVGSKNVTHIPIYKGDLTTTRFEMFGEMFERRTWSSVVANTITKDMQNHPLSTGEKLILVGNSGGGTAAIESLDLLANAGIHVDQAILRGSPVKEHALNNVGRVDYITSKADYYYSYDSNSHDGVDVQEHRVDFWGHVMPDNATRIKVADLIASLLGK